MKNDSKVLACVSQRDRREASPEAYEIANGMVPGWGDIGAALAHNRLVLRDRPQSMGLSVERETWMLHYVMEMATRDAVLSHRCPPA